MTQIFMSARGSCRAAVKKQKKRVMRENLSNYFVQQLIAIMNIIEDFEPLCGLRPPKPIEEKAHLLRQRRIRWAKAEREGFEPPDLLQSTVFKTAAFDRSAISPGAKIDKFLVWRITDSKNSILS